MKQPKQKPVIESALVKTAREIAAIRDVTANVVASMRKVNDIVEKARAIGNDLAEQIAELNHQEAILTEKLGNL